MPDAYLKRKKGNVNFLLGLERKVGRIMEFRYQIVALSSSLICYKGNEGINEKI